MNILDTLRVSASGLNAQRVRLQTISSNMANARSTSSTESEEPYRRKMPVFQSVEAKSFGTELDKSFSNFECLSINSPIVFCGIILIFF